MLAINQQIAPPTRPKIPPHKKIPKILQKKSTILPPNIAQSTKMETIAMIVAIIYYFYYYFFLNSLSTAQLSTTIIFLYFRL